ncbi:MAG: hypothetical protein R2793_00730 [Flavobacteriaceae bacterium]
MKKSILLIISIVVLATFFQSCCCNDGEPAGIIDCAVASGMAETFQSSNPGSTTNVTFDLDEIEKFVCEIKEKAKDAGVNNPKFEVYFAAVQDSIGNNVNTVFFAGSYIENGVTQNFNYYMDMGGIGNQGLSDIICN